jgi:DNA-binding XRE family transcriptional regulator
LFILKIVEHLKLKEGYKFFANSKIPKNPKIRNRKSYKIDGFILHRKIKKMMDTKDWKEIKDSVYGVKGTDRRDKLERDFESFKIGILLKKAREEKKITQEQLADLVDKKRTYISRVENDGSNMTLRTLYDIVEKGLGGKVKITIEL